MKSVVHNPERHADCSGTLDESHDAEVARRKVLGLLVTRGHTVWRRLICSATSAGYSDIPVSKRFRPRRDSLIGAVFNLLETGLSEYPAEVALQISRRQTV